jgi:hypothetical protein
MAPLIFSPQEIQLDSVRIHVKALCSEADIYQIATFILEGRDWDFYRTLVESTGSKPKSSSRTATAATPVTPKPREYAETSKYFASPSPASLTKSTPQQRSFQPKPSPSSTISRAPEKTMFSFPVSEESEQAPFSLSEVPHGDAAASAADADVDDDLFLRELLEGDGPFNDDPYLEDALNKTDFKSATILDIVSSDDEKGSKETNMTAQETPSPCTFHSP